MTGYVIKGPADPQCDFRDSWWLLCSFEPKNVPAKVNLWGKNIHASVYKNMYTHTYMYVRTNYTYKNYTYKIPLYPNFVRYQHKINSATSLNHERIILYIYQNYIIIDSDTYRPHSGHPYVYMYTDYRHHSIYIYIIWPHNFIHVYKLKDNIITSMYNFIPMYIILYYTEQYIILYHIFVLLPHYNVPFQ